MPIGLRAAIREPLPLRLLALRWLHQRLGLGAYPTGLELGAYERTWYGYCLLQSAYLAQKLGCERIAAIEFGVAGGNGLVALEEHARLVRKTTGMEVAVYGFDTGAGMPPPIDMRDMPYLWQTGFFSMDEAGLRARLTSAKLELGPVEETVARFFAKERPPAIGFISFDLDYYSSTVAALKILEADHDYFLPRVTCYFDDIAGGILEAYNEFTGELLAIKEFNETHADIKIGRARGLRYLANKIPFQWHEQVYVAHRFTHPAYGRPIAGTTELVLKD